MSEYGRYGILIRRSAEKEPRALKAGIYERVIEDIQSLESDPRPPGCKKLKIKDGYRIRVGKHRVIYTINDTDRTVEIFAVRQRDKAYR